QNYTNDKIPLHIHSQTHASLFSCKCLLFVLLQSSFLQVSLQTLHCETCRIYSVLQSSFHLSSFAICSFYLVQLTNDKTPFVSNNHHHYFLQNALPLGLI